MPDGDVVQTVGVDFGTATGVVVFVVGAAVVVGVATFGAGAAGTVGVATFGVVVGVTIFGVVVVVAALGGATFKVVVVVGVVTLVVGADAPAVPVAWAKYATPTPPPRPATSVMA